MSQLHKIELEQLQSIDFTKTALDDIKQELIDYIVNHPEHSTNFDSFYDADSGKMILDTWAYLARKLLLRIDILANENFPTTAQLDSSVIKILRLIGYELRSSSEAQIFINVDYPKGRPSLAVNLGSEYAVPAKDTTGSDISFYIRNNKTDYFSNVTIPLDTDGKAKKGLVLKAFSGELRTKIFDREGVLTEDGEIYVLDDSPVNQDSVRVFYYDTGGAKQEAVVVTSFLNVPAFATYIPCIVRFDEFHGAYIEMGDSDLVNVLPDNKDLEIYYTINGGETHNITENSANYTDTFIVSGVSVDITFSNPGKGFGGKEPETIEEAKSIAPMTLRTINRTVTEQDYEILLAKQGLILHSRVLSPEDNRLYFPAESKIPLFHVFIYITLNKPLTQMEDLLLTKQVNSDGVLVGGDSYDILAYLKARRILGIENVIKPTIFSRLSFEMTVEYNAFFDVAEVEIDVRNKLEELMKINSKNVKYENLIRLNTIISNLKALDGVIDIDITSFKRKTYTQVLDTVASSNYFKFENNDPFLITIANSNDLAIDYQTEYNEVAFLFDKETDIVLTWEGVEV